MSVNASDIEVEHIHFHKILTDGHPSQFETELLTVPSLLEIELAERQRWQSRDLVEIEIVSHMRLREIGPGGIHHTGDKISPLPTSELFQLGHEDHLQQPEIGEPLAPPAHGISQQIGRVAAAEKNPVVFENPAPRCKRIESTLALHPTLPSRRLRCACLACRKTPKGKQKRGERQQDQFAIF